MEVINHDVLKDSAYFKSQGPGWAKDETHTEARVVGAVREDAAHSNDSSDDETCQRRVYIGALLEQPLKNARTVGKGDRL